MRNGVRLGVDVGSVRIGVARCDPGGILASPLETVKSGKGDIDRLVALVAEHEAVEVVVGLPTSLSGREGCTARRAARSSTRPPRRCCSRRRSTPSGRRDAPQARSSEEAHE